MTELQSAPDSTPSKCELCGALVHDPCTTETARLFCELPDFCYRTPLDELNELRAENTRLREANDYWLKEAVSWSERAREASSSGGFSHDLARDKYRQVLNQNKVLRAAVEDAVETLEAMDLHLDNPLYERLREALEGAS
jgi:hypothetical protein